MVINRIINGTGHVYIDDEITPFNGGDIARQIMDFKSNGLHVVVNINSVGGSVFAGYQIIDAIIQTQADTHISGMAASIAGIIALFGHNVTANDFSTIMIHAPSGSNDDLLKIVQDRLKTILLSKTHLQEDAIEDLMNGKDHFFTAQQAHEMGFLTSEPINTGKQLPIETAMLGINEQFQVYNKLTKQLEMKEVINKLNLAETATEQDILNKIEGLENEATEALNTATTIEAEASALKTEVEELKAKLDDAAKTGAEMLITNAIKDGKIDEKSKDVLIDLAVTDYAKAEKVINAIVTDHATHVVNVKKEVKEDLTKDPVKLAAFMRDENAVKELQASNIELFNKYQEEYLK
jgi:ATP-dependent protease ClpP protease subunit